MLRNRRSSTTTDGVDTDSAPHLCSFIGRTMAARPNISNYSERPGNVQYSTIPIHFYVHCIKELSCCVMGLKAEKLRSNLDLLQVHQQARLCRRVAPFPCPKATTRGLTLRHPNRKHKVFSSNVLSLSAFSPIHWSIIKCRFAETERWKITRNKSSGGRGVTSGSENGSNRGNHGSGVLKSQHSTMSNTYTLIHLHL